MPGIVTFSNRYCILHLTWFAFFLTFMVWFNVYTYQAAIAKGEV